MATETYRNDELEDWCWEIDPEDESFLRKRLEATGIFQHPFHFRSWLKMLEAHYKQKKARAIYRIYIILLFL